MVWLSCNLSAPTMSARAYLMQRANWSHKMMTGRTTGTSISRSVCVPANTSCWLIRLISNRHKLPFPCMLPVKWQRCRWRSAALWRSRMIAFMFIRCLSRQNTIFCWPARSPATRWVLRWKAKRHKAGSVWAQRFPKRLISLCRWGRNVCARIACVPGQQTGAA